MKRFKKIITILLSFPVCAFVILLIIGIFSAGPDRENIEDRVLENLKIDCDLMDLSDIAWYYYKIPIIVEVGGILHDGSVKISYSTPKTTIRELLDAVVPKKSFVWRAEGDVIHIISRPLDMRSDYQLNVPIEKFSEKGNYNNLILKALEQVQQRNFPEPILFEPFSYKDWNIKKQLCPFKVKARNTTLRRLLDQIALKGGILYSVRRLQNKDGSYFFWLPLKEEGMFGLSTIKDPSEPEPPCPKI
ncbi:MAG: hypothetical protein HY796_00705 [Elusimicrobia bacterium]|nr:hypothetical protein [Elusimicrobiota bacterium]